MACAIVMSALILQYPGEMRHECVINTINDLLAIIHDSIAYAKKQMAATAVATTEHKHQQQQAAAAASVASSDDDAHLSHDHDGNGSVTSNSNSTSSSVMSIVSDHLRVVQLIKDILRGCVGQTLATILTAQMNADA